MFKTMNECLKKALNEADTAFNTDVKETVPGSKRTTTPEEVTQRSYSNTPRSAGPVSPEFQAQYDKAFQDQKTHFDTLSDEAKKAATTLWGDPRSSAYRGIQFDMTKVVFKDPRLYGLATGGKNVALSANPPGNDKTTLPHEMTHIQQFGAQTDPGSTERLQTDRAKPYREQSIEAGAQSKAEVLDTRTKKSPEESLKPLSDTEVEGALEKTRGPENAYTGFDALPDNIKAELKGYLKKMIVKTPTATQGTMA